jgi:hypothetical protein
MVSVHRPLHLRSSKKMTLAATEEFWHSPIGDDASDSDCGGNDAALSLPPAHHQLLSGDGPSFENLKGHDHSASSDDLDGYATSDSDSPTFNCRRKLSAVKQQGGGSWLLGFARLSNENADEPPDDMSDDEDMAPPGLVRVPSGSSLDEESSSDSESDDESAVVSTPVKPRRAGVSFSECVTVQPIPHSSALSPLQRRKMYSTSFEVRQNKIRNKKEYRYDGYDWRNVTEEWEMGVDMVTGELVHPVHEQA